jgi:hypothetical protein
MFLLGCIWLGVNGWNVARYWSGGPLALDENLLRNEHPDSWGDQHPECRNRFGVWLDGSRMDASEFREAGSLGYMEDFFIWLKKDRGESSTPEQAARDKWASDVRQKVSSCEQVQWLPIVKADAIRRERIRLSTIALLPPFLFLAGVGLTRSRAGKIRTIAGKVIAAAGALGIAVVLAAFVEDIGGRFRDFVDPSDIGFHWPGVWNGALRPDVVCALLIPIVMVLWRRSPTPTPKRIVACSAGIAAGLAPVMVEVLSWPLIRHSSGGKWAVAIVAVFAAAALSIWITKSFLDSAVQGPLAPPIVPRHILRGLIRLYVILLIPWSAWFVYTAYEANKSINYDYSQLRKFGELSAILDEPYPPARVEYARRELGLMALRWDDVKTAKEIGERLEEEIAHNQDRLTFAIYALLAGAAPPLLYPIFLWVLAGFYRPAASQPQTEGH